MVDYTVTPANVQPTGSLEITRAIAGAAITAGQPLRQSGGLVYPAQADALINATVIGISLNGAAVGQPVSYTKSGTIDMGTTFAVGDVVVLSAAAAGGIAPVADLVSTNAVSLLGVATTVELLKMEFNNSGVAIA